MSGQLDKAVMLAHLKENGITVSKKSKDDLDALKELVASSLGDELDYRCPECDNLLPEVESCPYCGEDFDEVEDEDDELLEEAEEELLEEGEENMTAKATKPKKETKPKAKKEPKVKADAEWLNKLTEKISNAGDIDLNGVERSSGVTYKTQDGKRVFKLFKAAKPTIEVNVTIDPSVDGYTHISPEEAKEKHMGTMKGKFVSKSIDDAFTVVKLAAKQAVVELKPKEKKAKKEAKPKKAKKAKKDEE